MQARVGSSRLPGKVIKELYGKTILEHDIERIRQANLVNEIIIATTTNESDQVIEDIALKCGVKCFRGSEEDVLSRYYYAAKEYEIDTVIRITSDCPLVDPKVIDEVIACYNANNYDVVTNVPNEWEELSYPRGLDLEIFSFDWLERAFKEATTSYDREHVSPFIYDHAKTRFYYKYEKDYSRYRLTLDTQEDWEVISKVYSYLYKGKHDFYMEDIIRVLEEHPEIEKINENVKQKLKH